MSLAADQELPSRLDLPLVIKRYLWVREATAAKMFTGEPRLHHEWGIILGSDRSGGHWTTLGDADYVRSLGHAAHELSPEEAEGVGAQRGVYSDLVEAEWPFERFEAQWLIRGWPEEWESLGAIDAYSIGIVEAWINWWHPN